MSGPRGARARPLPPVEAGWPWLGPGVLLGFGLVVGLLLRLWSMRAAAVIENEGAEYARIAENLLQGRGYQGIFGGPQLLFPPLYPALIALGALAVGDAERAGRLISLTAGILLAVPVFLVTRRLFGPGAAAVALVLATLHPLLVALSAAVYVEGLYLALAFGGLWAGLRALDSASWRAGAGAGVLLGLAYLARPEGLLLAGLLVLVLLAAAAGRRPNRGRRLAVAAAALAGTVVAGGPYALHLSHHTGGIRVEGKSVVNEVLSARIRRGLGYAEAARGLGPGLEKVGPNLRLRDQYALARAAGSAPGPGPLRERLAAVPARLARLARWLLSERHLVWPIGLLALVGAGALLRSGTAGLGHLLVASAPAGTLAALLTLDFAWTRYLFALVPLLVPWAAAGIAILAVGARAVTARLIPVPRPAGTALAVVAGAALCLGVVEPARRVVPDLGEFAQSRDRAVRDAGEWLARYRPGAKTIMGIGVALPFYAGGVASYLPYTDGATALAYIRQERPDFVVLRASEAYQAPYSSDWLLRGIPDPCAVARRRPQEPRDDLVLYEWTCH